jgi:branched-chain amino acid transport system substrate-binding protein
MRNKETNVRSTCLRLAGCIALLALVVVFPLIGQAAKDKIVIGTAISLSGPYASGAGMTQIPNYKLWVEEVNAKGGLYVKELNKKLPLELKIYDDKSDLGTAVKLIEQLILKDKVDFILPPWGTAMNFAIAPVINKYKYPVIGPTISSEKLREIAHKVPYFFGILNMPREQAEALVEILVEAGVKKVALIYVADAYGIEWTSKVAPDLGLKKIDIAVFQSYPLDTKDLSPLLKTIKAADVDALLCMSYPGDTFLLTKQARELGYNPKLLYLGVGVAFPVYKQMFGGPDVVEGIMGAGAWNPKVPYPGAKAWYDRHVKRWGTEPDFWASAFAYASLQILEQSIEKVGSLDRKKIRDFIATQTFSTVIGPVKFEGGFNVQSPGEIGQWQKGQFEIVASKAKRTAQPIYPKPPWPEEKKK